MREAVKRVALYPTKNGLPSFFGQYLAHSRKRLATLALKYSQSNFFHRGTICNLGTLFYTSQRLKLLYKIGPLNTNQNESLNTYTGMDLVWIVNV